MCLFFFSHGLVSGPDLRLVVNIGKETCLNIRLVLSHIMSYEIASFFSFLVFIQGGVRIIEGPENT